MIPITMILTATLGCNSECAHCCFACNLDKLDLSLTKEDMMQYIDQAKEYGISNVCFSGGEPFLCLDKIIDPIILAHKFDMYVDVRTNAYWANDYGKAYEVLWYLKGIGLNRVGLSYDKFHAETISLDCVLNVLDISEKLGLEVFLDWIGYESWEYVTRLLKIDSPILRFVGVPLKVGRAVKLHNNGHKNISIEDLETNLGYSVHCNLDATPLLTVFPEGYASYHPCCWVNPALIKKVGGNGWIKSLGENMQNSPMVNFLGQYGLGGLIRRGRDECPELVGSVYSHQCEICYDLLGNLFKDEVEELPLFIKEFKEVT